MVPSLGFYTAHTSLVKTVSKPARAWESNDGESGRTRRYLKDPTIIRGRLKAMIVWGEPLDRFAKRGMQEGWPLNCLF